MIRIVVVGAVVFRKGMMGCIFGEYRRGLGAWSHEIGVCISYNLSFVECKMFTETYLKFPRIAHLSAYSDVMMKHYYSSCDITLTVTVMVNLG